jgi:delta24-sterol reductase
MSRTAPPIALLGVADGAHEARVRAVARQVVGRPAGARLTIRKDTPSHSVRDAAYKRNSHPVDVSPLRHVLAVDPERLTATVEGQVLLGDLCRTTLAQGLLPRVVPEYPTFTVAGLINGEGIQSSSHRYGTFGHNVEALEVVLGDGEVVVATPDQHAELLGALPGSLGTLGVVTAATLRLMPAAPYVRSTYRHFTSLDAYTSAFAAAIDRQPFMEGVIFGPDSYVLVTAELAPDPGGLPLVHPERTGEPYYYQHVCAVGAGLAPAADAMETPAYLSRSVRGMWWMVECYADFPLLSETRWGRRLLDQATAEAFARQGFADQGLTVLERERCLVLQDVGVRLGRLREGIDWVQAHLAVYPLWNCAIRVPEAGVPDVGTTHVVDIGIYGEPAVRRYRCVDAMRALQRLVDCPSLWGVSYLTREELRGARIVDFDRNERVRRRYHAEGAFPHLEEKVVWVDPAAPQASGKIPLWRLYRAFGARWYLKPQAYVALALGAVTKGLFGALRWSRMRGARRREPGRGPAASGGSTAPEAGNDRA